MYSAIVLDKDSSTPLYQQLAEAVRLMIEAGTLPPERKLPPIRTLAKELSVNITTVVNAYRWLERKRYVYSVVGSGTYVSPVMPDTSLPEPILKNQYSARQAFMDNLADAVNFADTSTDVSLFPVEAFKKAFNIVLDRDGGMAFEYQDSQGYEPLRESLCGYLDDFGIRVTPDRLQIVSGAQQGIDILSKVLLSAGDVLFTEEPTFYGAVGAFLSRGAQVVEMPLEPDGPDMDKLESLLKVYKPKALYVMPNFQTPTGISYSLEKKRRLLELVYRYETYVIEEDNQSDFYYGDKRCVPLKALDYRGRVIYVKSFSKILMPGLRMGFMVLPKKMVVTTVKRNTDIATSGYLQRAFDAYLRSGDFTRHCSNMRTVYGQRYKLMLNAIKKHLPNSVTYDPPGGGLSFWLQIDADRRSWTVESLCDQLMREKIIVTPGAVFSARGSEMPCFRVSFAAVPEAKMEEGLFGIASVIRKMSLL